MNYSGFDYSPSVNTSPNKSVSDYGVEYITLTTAAQAQSISADYLIITDSQFWDPNDPNGELKKLSQHRASYSGFKVVVLNVNDILSNATGFPPSQQQPNNGNHWMENRIRTCIKSIYDNNLAPHTYDGHLAYVLLVGDAEMNTVLGVPSSTDPIDPNLPPSGGSNSSDYYYTLLTENANTIDVFPDIAIGRLSVISTSELHNFANKIIKYETEYSVGDWRNKSLFMESNGLPTQSVPYLNWFHTTFLPTIIHSPYSYEIVNEYIVTPATAQTLPVSIINDGVFYTQYYGHSHEDYIDMGIFPNVLSIRPPDPVFINQLVARLLVQTKMSDICTKPGYAASITYFS